MGLSVCEPFLSILCILTERARKFCSAECSPQFVSTQEEEFVSQRRVCETKGLQGDHLMLMCKFHQGWRGISGTHFHYTNSAEAKPAKHGPMKETASWVYILHPRFYITNKNPRLPHQHYIVGIRIHMHA